MPCPKYWAETLCDRGTAFGGPGLGAVFLSCDVAGDSFRKVISAGTVPVDTLDGRERAKGDAPPPEEQGHNAEGHPAKPPGLSRLQKVNARYALESGSSGNAIVILNETDAAL